MNSNRNPMKADHILRKGDTVFAFLATGDLFCARSTGCLLNGLMGNPTDGSLNNLWLRVHEKGGIHAVPLLGVQSQSRVSFGKDRVLYTGREGTISWQVTFLLAHEGEWLWDVRLTGNGQECDLIYGQDIGIADEEAILTNELYMAQYLGHSVFTGENGYTVCSRQNQSCGCGHPYLRQGMCLGSAEHFSTDGTQFFGLGCKTGAKYAALSGDLPDSNYQYELSYTGLQSKKVRLDKTVEMAFYGLFRPNHEDAIRAPEYEERVAALASLASALPNKMAELEVERPLLGAPLISRPFLRDEIDRLFPRRHLEETSEGELLSFFGPHHSHIVLQQKETLCERPHAVIHINPPNPNKVDSRVLASTAHMCGVFLSQAVVGNTSFHPVISTVRSPLNLLHNSGVRLYLRLGGIYRLLTMPAAFEMGVSYARWYYAVEDDILRVTVFVSGDSPAVTLKAESLKGSRYDMRFTAQLVFGGREFENSVVWEESGGVVTISGELREPLSSCFPALCYRMALEGSGWALNDDRVFFQDGRPRNLTLLTMEAHGRQEAGFTLHGCLYGEEPSSLHPQFQEELKKTENAFERLTCGMRLSMPGCEEAEKLNETLWWYAHNAMIHFASPHGIEQPGGAAWGTRDICQGPMEFFLATGQFQLARDVLCRIYSHQILQTREWPQWFMYDGYPVSSGECHGDVVFWPLKALADYLVRTGDLTILREELPYADRFTNLPSGETAPLLSHIHAAVELIEGTRFVGGTALVSYAGGDWDDTLQPADPAMREKLISSWTVALAFQTFRSLSAALMQADPKFSSHLDGLAAQMERDFSEKLIRNHVIAGFGVYEDGKIRLMLHPDDAQTGIHYRLLPLTRSIISELIDPPEAENNMRLIQEHLKFPDGVRLMDRPVSYDGGVSRLFLRAEQAANVGREVSLQYCHAHIRYLEACAAAGLAEEAWNALFLINPIKITDTVPNALTRQSNLYFSSSEGCFLDRYQYSREFDRLRQGSISVKGGWRLYSSGPGIYLNQLISHILGIQIQEDGILLSPHLPLKMDGLVLEATLFGRQVSFLYRFCSKELRAEQDGRLISSPRKPNRYGSQRCFIRREELRGSILVSLPKNPK